MSATTNEGTPSPGPSGGKPANGSGHAASWIANVRFVTAVLTAGVLAGVGAICFYAALNLAQLALWGDIDGGSPGTHPGWLHEAFTNGVPSLIDVASRASWLRRLLLPAAGGLIVGGIGLVLRGERRHGVSELLEVVGFGRRPTRAVNAARRVLAAIVTMASGGSAGQEGPIVQLGGSLAAATGAAFRVSDLERRTLVACGIAAGVAAAFNTPLGGAIFAIEVAIGVTTFDVVWPVVLAAVAAQAVSRIYLGPGPLYEMTLWTFRAAPARALPFCAILGALGGAAGGLYGVGLERVSDLAGDAAARFKIPRWALPSIGGLAVGVMAILIYEIHGNGYPFIAAVTSGHEFPVRLLLVLAVAKLVATCLTIGSGGGGGVFTPALFIGASLGGAFGWVMHAIYPGIGTTPAEFAVVGMAAVFAGTFHAPLTAIIVHLEMTRDLDASLALIVACLAAQATTRLFSAESIYHSELTRRGTSWSFEPRQRALQSRRVGEILALEPRPAIPPVATFDEITLAFTESRDPRLYVAGDRFDGAIDLHDVKTLLGERGHGLPLIAVEIVRKIEPLAPEDTLRAALTRLEADGTGELPVCDPANGRFLGVLTRAEIEASVKDAV